MLGAHNRSGVAGMDTAEQWQMNLKQVGIDDLVIRGRLRHSEVSTTRKHYIKTVPLARTDIQSTRFSCW